MQHHRRGSSAGFPGRSSGNPGGMMGRMTRSRPARSRPAGRQGKGRRRAAPKRPRWKKVLLVVAGIFLAGLLAVVGLVAWAYARTEIPDPNALAAAQPPLTHYAHRDPDAP